MIVLDTNVISEPMRSRPDPRVIRWLDGAPEVMLTATVVQELVHGLALLPAGRRRRDLEASIVALIDEDFVGRVLPYDAAAAVECGLIITARASQGRPIAVDDAQIAAVCLATGAALATRNVDDFVGLGLTIHNPWRPE